MPKQEEQKKQPFNEEKASQNKETESKKRGVRKMLKRHKGRLKSKNKTQKKRE